MLNGIDVSNHQGDNDINLDAVLPYYDFCICKATGGNFFVDEYCDGFVHKCKKVGKLWGFYHFANDGVYSNPIEEADFFYDNCRNYFHEGLPILDWEVNEVDSDWVNAFVKRIHDLTGVWCWIYGNPWRFSDEVEQNCARWVAAYPGWIYEPEPGFDPGEPPDCNGLVAAWQYASDGCCPAYSGYLDVNMYYGDSESWHKYCSPDGQDKDDDAEPSPTSPHVMEDSEYRVEIYPKM